MKKVLALVTALALMMTCMVFVSAEADVTATVDTVEGPFSAGDEIAISVRITEWSNAYAAISVSMPEYDESLLTFDGFDSSSTSFSGALGSSGTNGFGLLASPGSQRDANKVKSGEVCIMYFYAATDINVSTQVSVVVEAEGYTKGAADTWSESHVLNVETVNGGVYVPVIDHTCAPAGDIQHDETDHWYNCEVVGCGNQLQKAPHEGGEATCVAKAQCSVCGAEYGDVDSTNHAGDTEVRDAVPASCFEAGYSGDTYCLDCGEMIDEGDVVPATGNHVGTGDIKYDATHHWYECDTVGCGNLVDKAVHAGGEATCSAKAKCATCGQEYGDLDADNHKNTEVRDDVAASCFEEGYTGDTYCLDCGEMIDEGEVIPATGNHVASGDIQYDGTHHWYKCDTTGCDAQVNKAVHEGGEATCIAKAECATCGVEYGDIDATNHAGETEVRDASDEYTGDTYCLDCGEMIEEGRPILPNTGSVVVSSETVVSGEYVTVDVSIGEYTYLAAYQAIIDFDATKLELVDITKGSAFEFTTINKSQKLVNGFDFNNITSGTMFSVKFRALAPYGETEVGLVFEKAAKEDATHVTMTVIPGVITIECAHEGGEATCNAKAICTICGEKYGDFDATNHKGATEVRDAVTGSCGDDGYTGDTYCLDCETIIEEGEVIPATGAHTGGEATCCKKAVCDICGQDYGKINVNNHVGETEVRDAVAGNCGTAGYTGDTYCLDCDEMIEEGVVIPATGAHTGGEATCIAKAECSVCGKKYGSVDKTNHAGETEVRDAVAGNCGTAGYTGDTYCLDCGEMIEEGDVVPATGAHTGGTATCIEKATCGVCGKKYGDFDANNHAGETEVRNASAANCGVAGYTGDTWCLDCDKMIEEGDVIPATGAHTGGEATCIAKAKCSVCGNEYGDFDATNHAGETEVRDAVEGDCGNAGYTGDTYCLDCGEMIEEGDVVPATGAHTGGTATCTAKAKCEVCEQEYGNIDANNHVGETEVRDVVEGDCGKAGYTGNTYCLSCGNVSKVGATVPATGNHTGGEATCVAKAKCAVCGTEYGELDADNHAGKTEVRDASIFYSGDTYCLDCGEMIEKGVVLKLLGDADSDKEVTIVDAMVVARYSGGLGTVIDLEVSDVNGDGEVDIIDAMLIARYSGELIDKFPAEQQ